LAILTVRRFVSQGRHSGDYKSIEEKEEGLLLPEQLISTADEVTEECKTVIYMIASKYTPEPVDPQRSI
jgi:hypothetical protein